MAQDDGDRRTYARRAVLTAAAAGGAAGLAGALSGDGQGGSIYGGTMALSQEYNVAEDLWIGPDSAKSNVSAESGRVYMASDTQVDYYGDDGSWTKLGAGSSSEPLPSVTTDDATYNTSVTYPDGTKVTTSPSGGADGVRFASEYSGSDGGAQIQNAINDGGSSPSPGVVVVGPTGPDTFTPSTVYSEFSDVWKVDSTITYGSNTAIILKGADVVAGDSLNDQMFLPDNVDEGTPSNSTVTDHVAFVGIGDARIHGNAANQDNTLETPATIDFYPYKVDDLHVENIRFESMHAFGLCLHENTRARVVDCGVFQDGEASNQDAIKIIGPSSRVDIRGLYGRTADDGVTIDQNANVSSKPFGTDGDIRAVYADVSTGVVSGESGVAKSGIFSNSNGTANVVEDITFELHPASDDSADNFANAFKIQADASDSGNENFRDITVTGSEVRNNTFIDQTCRNVRFHGLNFRDNVNYIQIQGGTTRGLTITDCTTVPTTGSNADLLDVQNATLRGCTISGCRTDCTVNGVTGQPMVRFTGNATVTGFLMESSHFEGASATSSNVVVVQSGASLTDVDFRGLSWSNVSTPFDLSAQPVRVDGIIGGGPVGGVDLSSVNGEREGDLAVADGTSGANAGDLAKWDAGNTQWDVFQPATTV